MTDPNWNECGRPLREALQRLKQNSLGIRPTQRGVTHYGLYNDDVRAVFDALTLAERSADHAAYMRFLDARKREHEMPGDRADYLAGKAP